MRFCITAYCIPLTTSDGISSEKLYSFNSEINEWLPGYLIYLPKPNGSLMNFDENPDKSHTVLPIIDVA